MTTPELIAWLRENSSGVYRPAAEAADLLERYATTPAGVAIESTPLLDRSELIAILEETLSVTDEWGGCKLASWQWGNNVVVDGIDAAADAIIARLANAEAHGRSESGVER